MKDLIKRYIVATVGLFIIAFGVALSLKSNLGTAPVSCPPAVPIVVSGERISEAAVQMMQHYGIETVEVTACDK